MIHHERLRPPPLDCPADEWNVIEKEFLPEFTAQLETMLALGNGYHGMRACPEEGGTDAENSTLINGFHEPRPIVYSEEACGFLKTGQTIVVDCKITNFGQVAFAIDAQAGAVIQLTKYTVYHTSQTASAEELCGCVEWTMDRMVNHSFQALLGDQDLVSRG
jgi:trehalose/maltose hydrolase-like predicted phosphorylase